MSSWPSGEEQRWLVCGPDTFLVFDRTTHNVIPSVKRVLPPLESSNASRQFSHSQSVFGHGTKSDDSVSRACTNASKTKAAKYMKFEFLSEMRTGEWWSLLYLGNGDNVPN